jgi:hypothetical protein
MMTAIPADGTTIVMQNDPRGPSALGASGGALAYEAITPSIALEVDTLSNPNEPGGQHVGIDIDGAVNGLTVMAAPAPFPVADGTPFTAWLDYDASTQVVRGYIARSTTKPAVPLVTATSDLTHLGPQMWLGMTSSTGVYYQTQRVLAWKIDVSP